MVRVGFVDGRLAATAAPFAATAASLALRVPARGVTRVRPAGREAIEDRDRLAFAARRERPDDLNPHGPVPRGDHPPGRARVLHLLGVVQELRPRAELVAL